MYENYHIRSKCFNFINSFFTFLFLFFVVFDPQNSHFGLKTISFILLILINIKNLNVKYYFVVLICLTFHFTSFTFAILLNSNIDMGIANWNLNSFLYFTLILFVFNNHKFIRIFYYVTFLFSLFIVILSVFYFIPIENLNFIVDKYISTNTDFVMFGFRKIYKFEHFCLYYRTSAICILPFALSLILFKNKRTKLIFPLIFFAQLILSGARANMVAAVFIFLIYFFESLKESKKWKWFYKPAILFISLIFAFLFLSIILEKDHSNTVKLGHLNSFIDLFCDSPSRYFFVGGGPGLYMYSSGKQELVSLTELSYLELIKNYGLIFTILFILLLVLPITKLINNNFQKFSRVLIISGYCAFLFCAGTNPLLMGSTGVTTIIVMYCICNTDLSNVFKKSKRIRLYKILKYKESGE